MVQQRPSSAHSLRPSSRPSSGCSSSAAAAHRRRSQASAGSASTVRDFQKVASCSASRAPQPESRKTRGLRGRLQESASLRNEQVLRALASRPVEGATSSSSKKRPTQQLQDFEREMIAVDFPGWICNFSLAVKGSFSASQAASEQRSLRTAVQRALRKALELPAGYGLELMSLTPQSESLKKTLQQEPDSMQGFASRSAQPASSIPYSGGFTVCTGSAAPGASSSTSTAPKLWRLPDPSKLATFTEALARAFQEAGLDHLEVDMSTQASLLSNHPSELELRGGNGEPVALQSAPEGSRVFAAGVAEGFELVTISSRSIGQAKWHNEDSFQHLPCERVLAADRLPLPCRLIFRSPLQKQPNLSERQISVQLGLGRVREYHLRRLLNELSCTWRPLVLERTVELQQLHEACNDELVVEGAIEPGIAGVETGMHIRSAAGSDASSQRSLSLEGLLHLQVPAKLEVGHPREATRVRLLHLKKALRKAGICWLDEMQERRLFDVITKDAESGWSAVEEELGDVFVIDGDGMFTRIGKQIKPHHIHQATQQLKLRLQSYGRLDRTSFQTAMHAGGVTWLTNTQLSIMFNAMADAEKGLELRDWLSRFSWDALEAARDLQRALARQHSRSAATKGARELSRHGKNLLHKDRLHYEDFKDLLSELGMGWLSLEQQRVLFHTMDQNGDGCVTQAELRSIEEIRGELEVQREDMRAQAAAAAAEAAAAEAAAAEAAAAEAAAAEAAAVEAAAAEAAASEERRAAAGSNEEVAAETEALGPAPSHTDDATAAPTSKEADAGNAAQAEDVQAEEAAVASGQADTETAADASAAKPAVSVDDRTDERTAAAQAEDSLRVTPTEGDAEAKEGADADASGTAPVTADDGREAEPAAPAADADDSVKAEDTVADDAAPERADDPTEAEQAAETAAEVVAADEAATAEESTAAAEEEEQEEAKKAGSNEAAPDATGLQTKPDGDAGAETAAKKEARGSGAGAGAEPENVEPRAPTEDLAVGE